MSTKLNIEQLFSSKLEGLEQTPSPSIWKNTSRAVRRKQFFRVKTRRFNIYYLAAIVLVGAAVTYYLTAVDAKVEAEERNGEDVERLDVTTDTDNTNGSEEASKLDKQSLNDVNAQDEIQQILPESPDKKDPETRPEESLTTDETKSESKEDGLGISELDREANHPGKVSTLVPYFTPSVYEGCAPLTVRFVNSSINATRFSWNFGITESMDNPDAPAVTYTTPGTYTVTLTAMDQNGIQKTHSENITVHPLPDAIFEIDQNSIYNYSIDASEFSWYVVPNEIEENNRNQNQPFSRVFQPLLSEAIALGKWITENDAYLFLVAKNTFGCTDTFSSPLPESSGPHLMFPTAFSPNPNGSIGGYYNPNDPGNQVFHPKFDEVPESYQLRIFNKSGTLMFEASDIYIGWDGYYQEAPAPRGVYIFQCTGTWKNGKPFQYRGDITIL